MAKSVSYGLIVYTYHQDEIKFLMTLRRDTFCYECIIRGIYTDDLLEDYVSHITQEEKERILKYPFDMLWKDLWVSVRRRLYKIEYKKAKETFTKNMDRILSLVQQLIVFDPIKWEFPKGKMFSEETQVQCALREFQEETNIHKKYISILKNASTYSDYFTGNDSKEYQSVYHLGYIHKGLSIPFIYHKCPYHMRNDYVSDEVMSIDWFSYEQAYEVCTPGKRYILEKIHLYLFNKPYSKNEK
jgi:8-oxo-dGTP pyrophosphatase MutT (NUDIX family)